MTAVHILNLWNPLKKLAEWFSKHPAAVLAVIFCFHAITNLSVIVANNTPLLMDEALYFDSSGHMLEAFTNPDLKFFSTLREPHPPLQRLISLPFYLLFGYSPDVGVLSNLVASAVLIISLYHLGKELQGPTTGLLSAAITMLFPSVFGFSRIYMIEYSLIASVTLSLALMLKTKGFSRPHYTLAFGMSVGVGILLKSSYSAFVMGPFLWYLYDTYRRIVPLGKKECLRRTAWLLSSVLLGLLIASLWYVPHIPAITKHMIHAWPDDARIGTFTIPNILSYIKDLPIHLGWFFFTVALASLAYLLTLKEKRALLLYAWIIFSYIFFTFIANSKTERYILGYLPAFGLIIALACANLRFSYARNIVVALLLFGIIQFLTLSYLGEPENFIGRVDEWERVDTWGMRRADEGDWKKDELISVLNGLLSEEAESSSLITNDIAYSSSTLSYLQRMDELVPFHIYQIYSTRYSYVVIEDEYQKPQESSVRIFKEAEVVLMYEEFLIADARYPLTEDPIWMAWNWTRSSYRPVMKFSLPNGHEPVLYVKAGLAERHGMEEIITLPVVPVDELDALRPQADENTVPMEIGETVVLEFMNANYDT